MGCGTLALALPQPTQAHGGTQFERLRLLAARDGEGLTQTRLPCHPLLFCALCLGSCASLEQQLAFEPIELRLVAPLSRAVHQRQRLVQHLLSFVTLALLPVCSGQKGQRVWLSGLCPGRPVCRKALPYLLYALRLSSLLDQYPAPAQHPARQLERKSLRGRQGDERFCPLARDLHLPAHE